MVIGCPKCRTRLKIADEKIKPGGMKIKCPKCAAILMVKKPAPGPAAAPPGPQPSQAPEPRVAPRPPQPPQPPRADVERLGVKKVLVSHESTNTVEQIVEALSNAGYKVIVAADGVAVMLNAVRELPDLLLLDVDLPKVSGFDVVKRLKARPGNKDLKSVLISSKIDERREKKLPASMYGIEGYIDDDEIGSRLVPLVGDILAGRKKEEPAAAGPGAEEPEAAPLGAPPAAAAPAAASEGKGDVQFERARRLVRNILADIELYNPDKVKASIKDGSFQTVFSEDLKEGLRHYRNRIPEEVRKQGDFFKDTLMDYMEKKKKELGP